MIDGYENREVVLVNNVKARLVMSKNGVCTLQYFSGGGNETYVRKNIEEMIASGEITKVA